MGLVAEAFCETLWPTRCALCDAPGEVLCDWCRARLDVLDRWRACPTCGAAFGLKQCDHCTPVAFGDAAPFFCISALRYTDNTGALVKTYKDKGEQRLAPVLAELLADSIDPSWPMWANGITYITATKAAQARRGFDHMKLVAACLARTLGVPSLQALGEPAARDQRVLGRAQRKQNMQGRFSACRDVSGMRLILVDDVFTTGSTISEARFALEAAGAQVRCATIARA